MSSRFLAPSVLLVTGMCVWCEVAMVVVVVEFQWLK